VAIAFVDVGVGFADRAAVVVAVGWRYKQKYKQLNITDYPPKINLTYVPPKPTYTHADSAIRRQQN
jgi:hypothetical protein